MKTRWKNMTGVHWTLPAGDSAGAAYRGARIKGLYLELTAKYRGSFCTRFWTALRVPGGGSVSNSKLETRNSLIRSFVFGGIEFEIVPRGSWRIVQRQFYAGAVQCRRLLFGN